MRSLFLFIFIIFSIGSKKIHAQVEIISLTNSSFEDEPRAGWQPSGWYDAGFLGESAPDVQPYGGFGVTQVAQDKNTYLGLVVRDNKTWESVVQKLSKPLKKGQCYKFSIYLAKSERYVSPTKKEPNQLTNFSKGSVLRVYGGSSSRDKDELLAFSDVIEHLDWREYKFEFTPKNNDYYYFFLEAYYKMPTMFHYNGNLLLDNISSITSCNYVDPTLADNKNKNVNTKPSDTNKNSTSDNKNNYDSKEENRGTFNAELKTPDLKVGYIFELENLYFQADSSTITTVSEKALSKLVQFMKNNTTISIEIGGHTNSLPSNEYCDKLSSDRAKNVAEFLIKNGIDRRRITSYGYGKRKPIAPNDTEVGKQRNQRVEIKITDID